MNHLHLSKHLVVKVLVEYHLSYLMHWLELDPIIKVHVGVHGRFNQSNTKYPDDGNKNNNNKKIKIVAHYLDEARVEDENLDMLNWGKLSYSRSKIITK